MFQRLTSLWADHGLTATQIAEKVKFFFRCYSINRHKLTVSESRIPSIVHLTTIDTFPSAHPKSINQSINQSIKPVI
jgi:hypothetical protein